MGGSSQPPSRRPSSDPSEVPSHPKTPLAEGPGGAPEGQESAPSPRTSGCPDDFRAEVADIPFEMQAAAGQVSVGVELPIELREDDPAFLLDGEILGWLAVNIEEVTECLQAGWRYHGIVRANDATPAGPLILTQVHAQPPGS
jgi:hypothetical protein